MSLKLKSANLWHPKWPHDYRTAQDHEMWFVNNLNPRQCAFVAIYFLRETSQQPHAFCNWLESIIDQRKYKKMPQEIVEAATHSDDLISSSISNVCLDVVRAYLRTRSKQSSRLLVFRTVSCLVALSQFTPARQREGYTKQNLVARKQNRLLSLFLPIKNWQPSYHTTNTIQLAKTIYQTNNWSMCPILADALMDVGCTDPYILWLLTKQHHLFAKGVWIIDKLAGNPIK
jgi:hypothetical protein